MPTLAPSCPSPGPLSPFWQVAVQVSRWLAPSLTPQPKALTKPPPASNSSIRELVVSATNTLPDVSVANAAGNSSCPAPTPALPKLETNDTSALAADGAATSAVATIR